ncbi:mucin-5AC isoform X2 [Neocloeon triangulifer]|uniref:mucin-5AC isoform X2 n=1 Tax=Neocloeon triangulifer TaxID=2078957 RepID=UPI00286F3798|nr:mucin-5AC isoform X2 [Neocloeon triangulifer]
MWTKSVFVTLGVLVFAAGLAASQQQSSSESWKLESSAKLSQDPPFVLPSPSSSFSAPSEAPSFSSTSQAAASSLPSDEEVRPPVINELPTRHSDEALVRATRTLPAEESVVPKQTAAGEMPYQATAVRAARSIEAAATSKQLVEPSGEGRRAPRVGVTAVGPLNNNAGRRSEPQITDILGGIVKLFGGGGPAPLPAVVATMPMSRPIRPQGTRINNRGPPRITDVVLLNASTPDPPPFPFEKPISGMGPPPPPRRPVQPGRRPIFPDGPIDLPERPVEKEQETSTTTEATTTTTASSTTEATTRRPTTHKPKPTTEVSKSTPKAATEAPPPASLPTEAPILESSIVDVVNAAPPTASTPLPVPIRFAPRPGLVLDDPEFKPGAAGQPPPIITAPVRRPPGHGEVFDVTVSAIQGPGQVQGGPQIVTRPQFNSDDEVSIDGRKTYINLLPTETSDEVVPTSSPATTPAQRPSDPVTGQGVAVPSGGPPSSPPRRPAPPKRPPVRIDTCIVGDSNTCDAAQNEACRTEAGVSSCHCKPGHSRRKHREPCRRIVSLALNLRIDRVYEKRMAWNKALADVDSDEFQTLSWEAVRAVDSAMGMTPFSDDFMGAKVNAFSAGPPLVANMTLQLAETAETIRPAVRNDIQRHLLGAITRRNNNVGDSAVWVDKVAGAVSGLTDLDECINPELNDCHAKATCTNIFGTFRCACPAGLRDPWAGNVQRSGRQCEACTADFCNNRGQCSFGAGGERLCSCNGNFFGSQCEMDGEVLGVAIGAAVAAVLIIGLTLYGLCMWSRKWNREQQKVEMLSTRTGITSPVFSYMAAAAAASSAASVKSGMPPTTPAAYVSVEDRLRWAHIADVIAQNHYAPEPNMCSTRPSSAVFYPSLPVLYQQARPPPPPTNGPPDSSDEEDNQGLLGRNFHVPRPRSRAASIANQSAIYYDLDYDTRPAPVPAPRSTLPRPPAIPMATYGQFYRG